MTYNV